MKNFFKMVAATFVALFIFFGISATLSMCTFVGLMSMTETVPTLTDNTILRVKLKGTVVERSESEEMQSLRRLMDDNATTIALNDFRKAFQRAADNQSKIKAVYLDCGMLSAAPASIEEMRNILQQFRADAPDVPVIAYADTYMPSTYWLATIADSVFVNPQGTLGITGITMNSMFLSKALDKLGVEMQIFKVGTFKSAVEPYILNEMSEANRRQMQSVSDGIWREMSTSMADSRGIDPAVIDEFVDKGGFLQPIEMALDMNLVDGLRYRADVVDLLETHYADNGKPNYMSLSEMKQIVGNTPMAANEVAVLYAVGGIDDGSADGMNSAKITRELLRLADDDDVKAVVLRVNSPGGSAYGSEQMWDAARRLKEEKPLVVSMGDYAASGGYYMACNADCIVAQPTTLTGSIGIFGMIPNIEGLTDKIGINFDGVKTHELADMGDISRPMTNAEKQLLQGTIERGYELFVGRCADGRQTTADAIKSVAEGRVWLGSQANELDVQLVDTIGGLDAAIAIAASKANLSDGSYKITEYPRQKDFYTELLEQLNGGFEERAIRSKMGGNAHLFDQYQRVMGSTGIQALMPYSVQL